MSKNGQREPLKGFTERPQVAVGLLRPGPVQGLLRLRLQHSPTAAELSSPFLLRSGPSSGLGWSGGGGRGNALASLSPQVLDVTTPGHCLVRAEETLLRGTRCLSRPGSGSAWGHAAARTQESRRRVVGHSDAEWNNGTGKCPNGIGRRPAFPIPVTRSLQLILSNESPLRTLAPAVTILTPHWVLARTWLLTAPTDWIALVAETTVSALIGLLGQTQDAVARERLTGGRVRRAGLGVPRGLPGTEPALARFYLGSCSADPQGPPKRVLDTK